MSEKQPAARVRSASPIKGKAKRKIHRHKRAARYLVVKGKYAVVIEHSHQLPPQGAVVLRAAEHAGLLTGQKSERIGGRVPGKLLSAAMEKSGIHSQTELLEYALSKVALEDDYGQKLLALKGSIPADIDLT